MQYLGYTCTIVYLLIVLNLNLMGQCIFNPAALVTRLWIWVWPLMAWELPHLSEAQFVVSKMEMTMSASLGCHGDDMKIHGPLLVEGRGSWNCSALWVEECDCPSQWWGKNWDGSGWFVIMLGTKMDIHNYNSWAGLCAWHTTGLL